MADKPPLIFERKLGGLFPANRAAEDALQAITGRVRVDIRKTRGNVRRNGLYWACLGIAAPMLSDIAKGDAIGVDMLHKILKDRAGLYKAIQLPSGDVFKDYDSLSFAKMTEIDRMAFIDWALVTLSKWLGVDVTTLRNEADQAA